MLAIKQWLQPMLLFKVLKIANPASQSETSLLHSEVYQFPGVVVKLSVGIVAGHQIYEGYPNNDYIKVAEGVGAILVSLFFPEFTIVMLFNLFCLSTSAAPD